MKLSFDGLRCEQTLTKNGEYRVCLEPPAHLVWVADDRRAWLMCDRCARQFPQSPRLVAEGSNSKLTGPVPAVKKPADSVTGMLMGLDAKAAIEKTIELSGGAFTAKELRASTKGMNNGLTRMYLGNKLRAWYKRQP